LLVLEQVLTKELRPRRYNRAPLVLSSEVGQFLSLIHKHKVMITLHKHGSLESLPRQDLPHNSNSSLEAFNLSYDYLFASIGGFL
jgi:hypothetical protein